MVPLLVGFLAPSVHHEHLSPSFGALRSDPRDVLLDGDVRFTSVLGDQIARLS